MISNMPRIKLHPLVGENMQKLTIVYANEGGYTPGDAYDFYFGDDFVIREWVFRKIKSERGFYDHHLGKICGY